MRLNLAKYYKPRVHLRTHEGAPAAKIGPEQALRRSVLSCMLWEGEFYEDGVQIAGRIRELVPQVAAVVRTSAPTLTVLARSLGAEAQESPDLRGLLHPPTA